MFVLFIGETYLSINTLIFNDVFEGILGPSAITPTVAVICRAIQYILFRK
jgi:hypothetical protein